jgi:hypothetical protein
MSDNRRPSSSFTSTGNEPMNNVEIVGNDTDLQVAEGFPGPSAFLCR